VRNSPALRIIELLRADGYQVEAYDPLAEGYQYSSARDIAKGADCLVVLVEHQIIKEEFTQREEEIRKVMRHPLILRFYQ